MKLKPYPEYKPSGVEWLGEIPSHWEAKNLRYALRNLNYRRIPLAGVDRADMEKTYPYYGASGVIDHVDNFIFDEPLILVAEDGANLLSRSTPLAFMATGKYWVNNHAHILRPCSGDIRYWTAALQTFDYTPLISGAAQPKLTAERLGSVPLPIPPDDEQQTIADYLDRETSKLDQLSTKVEEAIIRLQEYRTALITAAVTGKIDVRVLSACGHAQAGCVQENTDGHGPARTGKADAPPGVGPCESVSVRVSQSKFPEVCAANGALSLLNLCIHLIGRQMGAQAEAFENEGGFTERLYRVRSQKRR